MRISIKELVLFALLGTIMFVSKIIMEPLPNIHILAALVTTYTIVYRVKALIPIYVFAAINLTYAFFYSSPLWALPYFYIWTILWGVVMLLPKSMPKRVALPVYMVVCAIHGFLYGTLYAPAQALMFGLSFKGTIAWIISGLPFDAIHGIGNIVCSLLVLPLSSALKHTTKNLS